jgi:hypothetical protein
MVHGSVKGLTDAPAIQWPERQQVDISLARISIITDCAIVVNFLVEFCEQ